jgi:outer membrane protein TolC
MTYLENVNTLITAKGQALTTLVTLCKALGGGW